MDSTGPRIYFCFRVVVVVVVSISLSRCPFQVFGSLQFTRDRKIIGKRTNVSAVVQSEAKPLAHSRCGCLSARVTWPRGRWGGCDQLRSWWRWVGGWGLAVSRPAESRLFWGCFSCRVGCRFSAACSATCCVAIVSHWLHPYSSGSLRSFTSPVVVLFVSMAASWEFDAALSCWLWFFFLFFHWPSLWHNCNTFYLFCVLLFFFWSDSGSRWVIWSGELIGHFSKFRARVEFKEENISALDIQTFFYSFKAKCEAFSFLFFFPAGGDSRPIPSTTVTWHHSAEWMSWRVSVEVGGWIYSCDSVVLLVWLQD